MLIFYPNTDRQEKARILVEDFYIYTIGYGNREQNDFVELLKAVNAAYLVDIRSQPYSKFNPSFNQNDLKFFLLGNNIKYVHMGDSLGGRPQDTSCYDSTGKVDYEVLKNKDFFLDGINRLKKAFSLRIKIAIMCSEIKPYECHRSKLVGRVLDELGIPLGHIDERGQITDQVYVMSCVSKGVPETDLFGEKLKTTSVKNYSKTP